MYVFTLHTYIHTYIVCMYVCIYIPVQTSTSFYLIIAKELMLTNSNSMGSLNAYHIGLCIRIELSARCQLEKQVIIKAHYCLHNCNRSVST